MIQTSSQLWLKARAVFRMGLGRLNAVHWLRPIIALICAQNIGTARWACKVAWAQNDGIFGWPITMRSALLKKNWKYVYINKKALCCAEVIRNAETVKEFDCRLPVTICLCNIIQIYEEKHMIEGSLMCYDEHSIIMFQLSKFTTRISHSKPTLQSSQKRETRTQYVFPLSIIYTTGSIPPPRVRSQIPNELA